MKGADFLRLGHADGAGAEMIQLHAGSGSWEIQLVGPHFSDEEWAKTRHLVVRLLQGRKRPGVGLLDRLPWKLYDGTNFFGDEFCVLYARVPIDAYVEASELEHNEDARKAATSIASAFGELGIFVRFVAFEPALDGVPEPVPNPKVSTDAAATTRALADADHLLQTSGAVSAVDRVHTALHGYLRDLCRGAEVEIMGTESLGALWKKVRAAYPQFSSSAHGEHAARIAQAMAAILDTLGTVRNVASVAHANEALLTEPEAMLAVNAGRALLHYVDATLRN